MSNIKTILEILEYLYYEKNDEPGIENIVVDLPKVITGIETYLKYKTEKTIIKKNNKQKISVRRGIKKL